jgi:hypothetical protein
MSTEPVYKESGWLNAFSPVPAQQESSMGESGYFTHPIRRFSGIQSTSSASRY